MTLKQWGHRVSGGPQFCFKLNKALQKFTGLETVPNNISYVREGAEKVGVS